MTMKLLDDTEYKVSDIKKWLIEKYKKYIPDDVVKFIYDNFQVREKLQTIIKTKRTSTRTDRQLIHKYVAMVRGKDVNKYVSEHFIYMARNPALQDKYMLQLILSKGFDDVMSIPGGNQKPIVKEFAEKFRVSERVGMSTWDRLQKDGLIKSEFNYMN